MHEFLHEVVLHGLLDSLKVLPFLFLAYLLMEWLEHRAGEKTEGFIRKTGPLGPLAGAALGVIPQCGMSTMASNLYAGRIITVGTLVSVFLSTSDEMLILLITEKVPVLTTVCILLYKVAVALIVGFALDFAVRQHQKKHAHAHDIHQDVHEMCEAHGCHCEKGIFLSALIHTAKIFLFVALVNLLLSALVFFLGDEWLRGGIFSIPVLSHLLCAIIGLVPNCAVSVLLTKFYMAGYISVGSMLAGLLPGAGVGLAVFVRMHRKKKECVLVLLVLVLTGLVFGALADLLPLSLLPTA
ncbi:MAG: arsenic efflux protein [Clostridia bacterium]|nr:arsenic efflux protein [Clostridia bacterium]